MIFPGRATCLEVALPSPPCGASRPGEVMRPPTSPSAAVDELAGVVGLDPFSFWLPTLHPGRAVGFLPFGPTLSHSPSFNFGSMRCCGHHFEVQLTPGPRARLGGKWKRGRVRLGTFVQGRQVFIARSLHLDLPLGLVGSCPPSCPQSVAEDKPFGQASVAAAPSIPNSLCWLPRSVWVFPKHQGSLKPWRRAAFYSN